MYIHDQEALAFKIYEHSLYNMDCRKLCEFFRENYEGFELSFSLLCDKIWFKCYGHIKFIVLLLLLEKPYAKVKDLRQDFTAT